MAICSFETPIFNIMWYIVNTKKMDIGKSWKHFLNTSSILPYRDNNDDNNVDLLKL